jgi:hypothetical protein
MINASELLAAHAAQADDSQPIEPLMEVDESAAVGKSDAASIPLVPNPDRTHVSQPRRRLYVATPRSAS